jgi:hypothetical protein
VAFVPEGQHDSARHEVPGSEVPGIMRKIARPSGTIERISFRLDASRKNGMPALRFDDKYPWD